MNKLGRDKYIKKPKKKTNPRGVEISSEALRLCINLSRSIGYCIPIFWQVPDELRDYNPYTRWVELWAKD